MTELSYKRTTLRDFYELLKTQDVIVRNGVECLWGAQAREYQPGAPTIACVMTEDRYEQHGAVERFDTALPALIGPASKGLQHVEVATNTLWTRIAGLDLVCYAVEPTAIEEMIKIILNALHPLLGSRGNYEVAGGRHDMRGGYSDLSDTYILSLSLKLPIYELQRRYTAEAVELEEVVDGP